MLSDGRMAGHGEAVPRPSARGLTATVRRMQPVASHLIQDMKLELRLPLAEGRAPHAIVSEIHYRHGGRQTENIRSKANRTILRAAIPSVTLLYVADNPKNGQHLIDYSFNINPLWNSA